MLTTTIVIMPYHILAKKAMPPAVNLGSQVAEKLVEAFRCPSRNITSGRFFTGIALF